MAEIGQALHEARIRARIDISEMEARTKIRAKYLRALENEEWDLLPGDIFVKSFLKTYGDALGLDSRLLVDEFKRLYERPPDHEGRASPRTGRDYERERTARAAREPRGPLLSSRAMVATVIVLIVVALGVYGALSNSSSNNSGNVTAGGGNTTHKHSHGSKTTTGKTNTTKTSTTKAAASNPVTLQIVPTAEVYICLERSTGTKLIPGVIYSPGETVPSYSGHTFLLTLGNTGAELTVNGKQYPVTATSDPVGLKINATGVHALSPGPDCG